MLGSHGTIAALTAPYDPRVNAFRLNIGWHTFLDEDGATVYFSMDVGDDWPEWSVDVLVVE